MKLFRLLEDLQLFHGSPSQTALYLRAERPARIIQVCRGMCPSFRRGAGVGSAVVPPPNPQTVACGRGTSRQDEKTFRRSDERLLSREKSRAANAHTAFPRT